MKRILSSPVRWPSLRLVSLSLAVVAAGAPTVTRAAGNEKAECATAAETAEKLRAEKHLAQAREGLLRCSRETCPRVVRTDCLKSLAELAQSQPTVVLRARDADGHDLVDVDVTIDGSGQRQRLDGKAWPLDPGAHELSVDASSAGFVIETQTLVVAEGEKNRVVTLTLRRPAPSPPPASASAPPAPRPPPPPASTGTDGKRTAAWITGGVGVAGLAVFGALELLAHSRYAELRDGCGVTGTCASGDVDALRTRYTLSGVALGVGVLGVATSAVLFAVSKSDSVSATAGGGSAGVSFLRRF